MFEVDQIHGNLHQGSFPWPGDYVAELGFDVLVLAARENQDPSRYPGVEVIVAPGDDDPRPHRLERFLPSWKEAAAKVAHHVRDDKKVLVTCMGGYNRSGFISAYALHILTGWSGDKCVELVREQRKYALGNETFAQWLVDNCPGTHL